MRCDVMMGLCESLLFASMDLPWLSLTATIDVVELRGRREQATAEQHATRQCRPRPSPNTAITRGWEPPFPAWRLAGVAWWCIIDRIPSSCIIL